MGSIEQTPPDYDTLIIGAGLSGCYACYRMREQNMTVKVLEAGTSVGGTWYWNRYPGARFDCESYTYGFSWSQEVLDEWDWTEHFAPQPETERYIKFVCDKFGLWENMQFNTRIASAQYLPQDSIWKITDTTGKAYTCRFLITAMGILSNPTLPNVPGVSSYKGITYHTSTFPKEPVDFQGKKVGIIGTGATAIQAIPEIAKVAGHLTVFQRTPNWAIPLHNKPIDSEEMKEIRRGYPELFEKLLKTRMSFLHDSNPASIWDATPEEREVLWEHLYAQPGFGMWVSNYKEILIDEKANDLISEFIAKKIRQRVHDPATAEKLIPTNHGFGTRRVPMETFYYEAFNQDNVSLVDLNDTPIKQITEEGLQTSTEDYKFDILIYATGFSAITGAFDAIDFRGLDGHTLANEWSDGLKTFLGMTVQHFPNMFMIMGPHQAYGNIPRSIEYAVGWISECIKYLTDHKLSYIEAKQEGVCFPVFPFDAKANELQVEEWTEHVHECSKGLLGNNVDSWMTGVNKNVAGKQKRIVARYSGAVQEFRRRCKEVSDAGYDRFKLA